jgi:hypothetical protein
LEKTRIDPSVVSAPLILRLPWRHHLCQTRGSVFPQVDMGT